MRIYKSIILSLLAALLLASCKQPDLSLKAKTDAEFGNNESVPSDAFIRHLGFSAWQPSDKSQTVVFYQSAVMQDLTWKKGSQQEDFSYRILDESTLTHKTASYPRLEFSDKDHFTYYQNSGDAGTAFVPYN